MLEILLKEKLNPEFTLEAFGVLPENVNFRFSI